MTTIRSVARASRMLVLLGEQPEGRTAKEVADELGLPLPTAYHLLGTLVAEGLVAKDSRRRYRLGSALGPIADAYVRQFSPPEYLVGPLHRLAEESGETAYVGSWRHDRIVVLASVEGANAVRVSGAHLGYVESAHARASGKLLLAFATEEVRAEYLRLNPLVPVTTADDRASRTSSSSSSSAFGSAATQWTRRSFAKASHAWLPRWSRAAGPLPSTRCPRRPSGSPGGAPS